jgi:hypothetical protein
MQFRAKALPKSRINLIGLHDISDGERYQSTTIPAENKIIRARVLTMQCGKTSR